jgi:type I restriction enzyme S subunit
MKLVKLGNLASIQTGKIDVNKAVVGGKYPFFTCSRDVYEINDAPFEGKAVLVAGNGDLNVKYYEGKFNAYQRTYFLFVNNEEELLPRYLYWFLESYVVQLRSESIGSTIKYIKMGNLTDAEIPLLPIGKQRKIVEKLDSAFAEIDLLEENLELVEERSNELLYSLLNESFTYPLAEADSDIALSSREIKAKMVRLKDVISFDKKQGSFDLPYVGLEDIESNTGSHLGSREPRKVKSNSFAFTSNHLLYGRLRPYLNKVLLPDFDGHCSTEIFPIKVTEDISREYLYYWFRLPSTVEAIDGTSTGARMPRANMDEVLEFTIPLPPKEKQGEIVQKLDTAFAEIELLKAQIKTEKDCALALRQSLLSSALTQEEAVA